MPVFEHTIHVETSMLRVMYGSKQSLATTATTSLLNEVDSRYVAFQRNSSSTADNAVLLSSSSSMSSDDSDIDDSNIHPSIHSNTKDMTIRRHSNEAFVVEVSSDDDDIIDCDSRKVIYNHREDIWTSISDGYEEALEQQQQPLNHQESSGVVESLQCASGYVPATMDIDEQNNVIQPWNMTSDNDDDDDDDTLMLSDMHSVSPDHVRNISIDSKRHPMTPNYRRKLSSRYFSDVLDDITRPRTSCKICSLLHPIPACPRKRCFSCLEFGHVSRKCPLNSGPRTLCTRCNMRGHDKLICPEIWRQHHSLNPEVRSSDRRNRRVSCYNCGSDKHLGHACKSVTADQYSWLSVSPFVSQYDCLNATITTTTTTTATSSSLSANTLSREQNREATEITNQASELWFLHPDRLDARRAATLDVIEGTDIQKTDSWILDSSVLVKSRESTPLRPTSKCAHQSDALLQGAKVSKGGSYHLVQAMNSNWNALCESSRGVVKSDKEKKKKKKSEGRKRKICDTNGGDISSNSRASDLDDEPLAKRARRLSSSSITSTQENKRINVEELTLLKKQKKFLRRRKKRDEVKRVIDDKGKKQNKQGWKNQVKKGVASAMSIFEKRPN